MAWTEETVETLRNMWAAGASAREIGERIDLPFEPCDRHGGWRRG